jgi:hypothetical protein
MKAKLYDQIEILVEVEAEFGNRFIPKGTLGTVVECYKNPERYAVDLGIPNQNLVGGFEYENVILSAEQLTVVDIGSKTPNIQKLSSWS